MTRNREQRHSHLAGQKAGRMLPRGRFALTPLPVKAVDVPQSVKAAGAVLTVLALVVGLFGLLTVLAATEPARTPFGETGASADAADPVVDGGEETGTDAQTQVSSTEAEGITTELPINEHYGRLYPNEARIATYLHERGLDDMHIAAIIGVLKRESGNGDYDIEPSAVEDNLIGHGIAQWSFERWAGSHYDRPWQGLKYYAQDVGRNWEDLDVQLDYLWGEMTGEGPAADYVAVQYDHEGFLATSSLDEAVDFYLAQFINCAAAYDDRLGFAYATYEKLGY